MRVLLVHPGASWSTADVEAGLRYGLERHGVDVIQYRLDNRIEHASRFLNAAVRRAQKGNPSIQKPTTADIIYLAGSGTLERALRFEVDAVLVVSAMFLHPDIVMMLKRAGLRVATLFTESPYDSEKELAFARLVDGCWTNERSALEAFRAVNPNSGYLPHAWHPERHRPGPVDPETPRQDVVFVGSGFSERIEWFNAIDWTGIDLGLYGSWASLPSRSPLRRFVKGGQVDNVEAAALYRAAKMGLNLYRQSVGSSRQTPRITYAESLNPRAYELAACGAFHLSDYRPEVEEVFGATVPTFRTPQDAEALIRRWLPDEAGRASLAKQLPARVAESSWTARAARVIGDLTSLVRERAA